MAKPSSKKQIRPVRSLVSLIVIIILIYASVGIGVASLHWGDITANASNFWTNLTNTSKDSIGYDSKDSDDEPEPEDTAKKDDTKEDTAKKEEAKSTDSEAEDEPDAIEEPVVSNKVDPVSFIPKFALDLAGGTQIILTPILENGAAADDNALNQAIDVIRQRIDASGVAESEIQRQGSNNIVVGIPGETPSDETIKLISHAAKMSFRPVLVVGGAQSKFYSAAMGQKSQLYSTTSSQAALETQEEQDAYLDDINLKDKDAFKTAKKDDTAKSTSRFDKIPNDIKDEFDDLDCSKEENRKGGSDSKSKNYVVTCDQEGQAKYLLAPVAVEGDGIAQANAGLEPTKNGKGYTNNWIVSLKFKDAEDQQFIDISEQLKVLDSPRNQFAITLDDLVISAPQIEKTTTFVKGNGVQISGGNDQSQAWANTLANQLSFGALPMSFNVDSKEQVSASLGSEQLQKGLFAGIIGLLLVILYSLYQYRALGLVTIGSLAIASALTYGVVLLLSWQIGYRLSLPGIIGFIVSIGITADSFIVYFERVRDELRDNRSLEYAVTRGWNRALRTIMASDFVNVLCAVILYFLAVGGVRGFAFTLGLTTAIDFVVVCMFTFPMVVLLSKVRFFAMGHPLSGFSAHLLGATSAKEYVPLTKSEKKALKANKLRSKKEAKILKAELKKQKAIAKEDANKKKKQSIIDRRAHELEMHKQAALLKAGASDDQVFGSTTKLTIAEKRALAEGKDLKKLAKAFQSEAAKIAMQSVEEDFEEPVDEEEISKKDSKSAKKGASKKDAESADATTKKKAVKKPAVKSTSKSASKGADVKGADVKGDNVKPTAKPAVKKPAVKKPTTAKTSTKTDGSKPAVKKPAVKKATTAKTSAPKADTVAKSDADTKTSSTEKETN